ncbi:integrase [Legionella taurinensis]|nr:integrase [Legionella taurinensis]
MHVDPVVIEKCLGHKMPKIMATYNKNEMPPQRKEALERWSQQIQSLSHDNSDVAWMKQREIQEPMSAANSF